MWIPAWWKGELDTAYLWVGRGEEGWGGAGVEVTSQG